MVVAELEVFHSRPIAPTRRVVLGRLDLPVDPAPGFGGVLLGAVMAAHVPDIDPDFHDELLRLTFEVEEGRRISQPRLRHRLQSDTVGLQRSTHRLVGRGDRVTLDLSDDRGSPAQQVLAAVYAAGTLDAAVRGPVMRTVRRRFRELLRAAHPDHGGARKAAAQRIADLTEARRILLP